MSILVSSTFSVLCNHGWATFRPERRFQTSFVYWASKCTVQIVPSLHQSNLRGFRQTCLKLKYLRLEYLSCFLNLNLYCANLYYHCVMGNFVMISFLTRHSSRLALILIANAFIFQMSTFTLCSRMYRVAHMTWDYFAPLLTENDSSYKRQKDKFWRTIEWRI